MGLRLTVPPPSESIQFLSKFLQQFLSRDAGLLENGLQRLRFDVAVHGHAGMESVFDVEPMRAGLANKFKTEPFQGPADFFP